VCDFYLLDGRVGHAHRPNKCSSPHSAFVIFLSPLLTLLARPLWFGRLQAAAFGKGTAMKLKWLSMDKGTLVKIVDGIEDVTQAKLTYVIAHEGL
jgi:hypothetical protein